MAVFGAEVITSKGQSSHGQKKEHCLRYQHKNHSKHYKQDPLRNTNQCEGFGKYEGQR